MDKKIPIPDRATEKSAEVDRLISENARALTGVAKNRPNIVATGQCMTCSDKATGFRDELSAREYEISGMCQKCQDGFFGPPPESDEG